MNNNKHKIHLMTQIKFSLIAIISYNCVFHCRSRIPSKIDQLSSNTLRVWACKID